MSLALSEYLPLIASAPEGIQKLRELILDLAVRGKLVPQDPKNEPASELLKRIEQERVQLEAAGICKKSKRLLPVSSDEQPFRLPSNWEWVRLPEVYFPISPSSNKLLSSAIQEAGTAPVIDQGKRYVAGYTDNASMLIKIPGPVVIFGDHTTERKYVDFDFVAGADGVKILRPILQYEKFFFRQLQGFKLEGRGYARHFKVLNDQLYALPPLAEQCRIVAKVDELMALCDRLESEQNEFAAAHTQLVETLLGTLTQSTDAADFEANWKRIAEHFDTLFTTKASIEALQKTILQMAISGKLVQQNLKDTHTAILFTETKSTTKFKHITPLSAKDYPFKLPPSWSWVRFDSLISVEKPISYGVLVPGPDTPGGVPFVRLGDLSVNSPAVLPEKTIAPEIDAQYQRTRLEGGEILMGVVGSIGKLGVAPLSWKGANIARAVCRILPTTEINKDFLLLLLQSEFMQQSFKGNTKTLAQPTLNIGLIRLAPTPLPPLSEQIRIASKVDELMSLCDSLKKQLAESRNQEGRLADTLIQASLKAA